jgi:hypothetical protein
MHTFKVVKEPLGWAVRMDAGMCTPFRSRDHAIREADGLCEELRRHGVQAEVVVEDLGDEAPRSAAGLSTARLALFLRGLGQLRSW